MFLFLFHASFHVGVADKPKQNVVLVMQLMMCKILQTFCEIKEFYVCAREFTHTKMESKVSKNQKLGGREEKMFTRRQWLFS
jgi:hypothetical protein